MPHALTNLDLIKSFAQGAHGPMHSSSRDLSINQGGELQSYGTTIIRRDMRQRVFQIIPGDYSWSHTTTVHINTARKHLLAEGFKELGAKDD